MFSGLVLAAVVVLAAVSGRTGLAGALALGVVSALWLRVNGAAEGPVLWAVSAEHGLTVTDMAGLAGLAVSVWRAGRVLRRSTGAGAARGSDDEPPPSATRRD